MDFDASHPIGQKGELAVSAELRRLAETYGFLQIDDLLLEVKPMTTQIDHVVVDQYGVLIIETKVRNGALIMGRDGDKKWTAVYSSSSKRRFQNPLDQTAGQENVLRQAVAHAGFPIDPDFIQCAVVFSGANLSRLDLRTGNRERVLGVSDLDTYFAARRDFAVNTGDWTAEDVAAAADVLRGLNRARDPEVMRRHTEYRRPAAGATTAPAATQAPARPLRSQRPRPPQPPASGMPRANRRLLAGAGLVLLLALCSVPGLAFWIGNTVAAAILHPLSSTLPTPVSPASLPQVDDTLARQRLLETSPETYQRVADLYSPIVAKEGQLTTFTWHYVARLSNSSAKAIAFTLVIDRDGKVKSVRAGK